MTFSGTRPGSSESYYSPVLKENIVQTRYLLFLFYTLFMSPAHAQQAPRPWNVLIQVPTKISVGKASNQRFNYRRGITIFVPRVLTFTRPQTGLEISLLRTIKPRLRAGIGGGISLSFYEKDRIPTITKYYTHATVPFYVTIAYAHSLNETSSFTLTGKLGLQLHQKVDGGDENGFFFRTRGGQISAISASYEMKVLQFPLSVNIGYEIHQYNFENRLDWVDTNGTWGLTPEDRIEYAAYAKMLQLGVSVRF